MFNSQVVHHYYIHNVIGSFVGTIAAFLSNELYRPTTEVVIGTYGKALQHYTDLKNEAEMKHIPEYPFMTFDPGLDIEPDDIAGRFPHQYPNISELKGSKQWKPAIYSDDNVTISPVLNRYRGTFEIILWCRSVYEYLDLKILTHQFFGGPDRTIYPVNVSGYFVIPNCLRYYTYDNKYTLENYQLDWSNSNAETVLYKTLNRDKFVYPFSMRPYLKLASVSDASEKYGGDELAEYKLQATIEWETDLPTHMVLVSNVAPRGKFVMDIGTGAYYLGSTYTDTAPEEIQQILGDFDTYEVANRDLVVKERYAYSVTGDDISNLSDDTRVNFSLPEQVSDRYIISIYHPDRKLEADYDFVLSDSKDSVVLIPVRLKSLLEEDDILTVVIYEEVFV